MGPLHPVCIQETSLNIILSVQVCHVRKKDIRKFLDGVYVEEKGYINPPEEA